MKQIEMKLDTLLLIGKRPTASKFYLAAKKHLLRVLDDKLWELIRNGKTPEEAFEALGLKRDGKKPQ